MTNNSVLDNMVQQGYGQLKEGFFEDAIETFSACHALEASDDRALRGRGLAYARLKKSQLAEVDFLAAKALNENEPENWMGLGLSLAMQNKIYESIAIYEKILERWPHHVATYLQLGHLFLKIGTISKGKEYFTRALTHRPTLEQRKTIEAILKEQTKLDAGRYYKPDFDLLNKQQGDSFLVKYLRGLVGRFKKKVSVH